MSRLKLIDLRRLLLFSFLIFAQVFFVAGCAISHKYGPYYGRVIDADTKQPIIGAAVLVVHYTEHWGLAGSMAHFADAQETLTDKNGEFRIPAKRVNTFRALSGWELYPQVRIFKPGYGCFPRHRGASASHDNAKEVPSASEVPGWSIPQKKYETIKLPRLRTREERMENYGCYPSEIVPVAKYKKLFALIQQARVDIGLEPRQMPRKERQ